MPPLDDTNYVARDVVAPHPARPATDEVLSVLIKAREWLIDPAHWCRGCLARNGDETAMSLMWSNATPYTSSCSVGAVFGVGASTDTKVVVIGLLKRSLPPGFSFVHDFNDDPATTHADVLALFDRTIESRKASKKEEV